MILNCFQCAHIHGRELIGRFELKRLVCSHRQKKGMAVDEPKFGAQTIFKIDVAGQLLARRVDELSAHVEDFIRREARGSLVHDGWHGSIGTERIRQLSGVNCQFSFIFSDKSKRTCR